MWNHVPLRWTLAVVALMASVAVVQWILARDQRTAPAASSASPTSGVAPQHVAPLAVAPVSETGPSPCTVAAGVENAPARRRQAILSLPRGTYVKAFELEPYCQGRIVWAYLEEDRVHGTIQFESELLGVSAELAIDSEIALSSSGVVFGVITGVRLNHVKMNPQALANWIENMPLKVGPKLFPLIEPLVNEALIDTPFSYQCRVREDRLTISHLHIGPCGPVMKYVIGREPRAALIQAPALAVEGTYQRSHDNEPLPGKRPTAASRSATEPLPSGYRSR
jgi:hypothetical protein